MASGSVRNHLIAFSGTNNNAGAFSGLPKCTNFLKVTSPHRNLLPRIVAHGSGGGCCGGSGSGGSSCSSHRKSADLSNVGKEFEAMVSRATLTEFEKDYNAKEMEGNISREIIKEVWNTGPSSFAHQQKGETILDLDSVLPGPQNALKSKDFAFDNAENVFV